jgi:hypothetical protein
MKFTQLLALLLVNEVVHVLASYDAFPASEGPFDLRENSPDDNWVGEDFGSYSNGDIIECSNDMSAQPHLDVTSGCLKARNGGKNSRQGWTDDFIFRMVTISRDQAGEKIMWTDQTMAATLMIRRNKWDRKNEIENYSGLHVFFRYQDSDNLYVASARNDGQMTIKQKCNGTYETLAVGKLPDRYLDDRKEGRLKPGVWINLKVSAVGPYLTFYIDGEPMLNANSVSLEWGTTGIRTDNVEIYFDDLKMGEDY